MESGIRYYILAWDRYVTLVLSRFLNATVPVPGVTYTQHQQKIPRIPNIRFCDSKTFCNHPTQKILLVTHSNAALNDLFEKIMERDVAPRHLLRLGSGELELRETLATSGAGGGGKGQGEAFSKQGRVNWSLTRRLQLLAQVQRLCASVGVAGDVGNTCETAAYFRLEHVQSRIEKFRIDSTNTAAAAAAAGNKAKKNTSSSTTTTVQQLFPFTEYCAAAPAPLFCGDWAKDMAAAEGCFVHLNRVFEELADYRAFELLRSQSLRSDFLLTKQVGTGRLLHMRR